MLHKYVLGAVLSLAVTTSMAEMFPNRDIHMISVGAGGAIDTWTRIIGAELQRNTGVPVVVENFPGAANMIAAQRIAKAAPDGYTLGMGSNGTHALNEFLYSSIPYDPVKDFSPITYVGSLAYVLIVSANSEIKDWDSFLSVAKSKKDGLTLASTNNTARLAGESLGLNASLKLTPIPYKVGGTGLVDLQSGKVDAMIETVTVARDHIRNGTVKAIGVTSKERSSVIPDVPSLEELGLSGFDVKAWVAYYGPAGIPGERVQHLSDLINRVLQNVEVREKLLNAGLDVQGGDPASLKEFQARERENWEKAFISSGMNRIN